MARKFEAESDNLRLALEWSFSDLTDVEAGPRLVMATWGAFPTHEEEADWFKRAVALCQSRADVSASLYARLWVDASHLTALNDPQTALAMTQQAVEISRRLGPEDKYTLMLSLIGLGWTYMSDLDDVTNLWRRTPKRKGYFRRWDSLNIDQSKVCRAAAISLE